MKEEPKESFFHYFSQPKEDEEGDEEEEEGEGTGQFQLTGLL